MKIIVIYFDDYVQLTCDNQQTLHFNKKKPTVGITSNPKNLLSVEMVLLNCSVMNSEHLEVMYSTDQQKILFVK